MTSSTSALFPALPLPSMVKLNTELGLAALLQLAQTETNKFIATARTLPHCTAAVPRMPCLTAARYRLRPVPVTFTVWLPPAWPNTCTLIFPHVTLAGKRFCFRKAIVEGNSGTGIT